MSNVCVYSFADASGVTKYVDSVGDYYYNGTWSASGTYSATPLNAVGYGAAQYMCIRDNIGDNPQRVPTRTRPQSWSIMSLLYEYQCSGTTSSGSNALAEAAYALAQTGTNIAWAAYYLAQIGTNTGSAAYDLAGSAYSLAGSAATDAATALTTANGAFAIAVAGTNAAATAQSTADAAYALAQIGTNTGTAAYNLATTGSNLAWQAYLLASGTDSSGIDATARSTADFAYYLAQVGTNTGTAALNAAATAQSVADFAYYLAQVGTNTGTAAYDLAQSSGSLASNAYLLAVSGTNLAQAAYTLAQIGTNTGTAAYELAGSAYALAGSITDFASGGTMTGNLTVPNVIVSTGTVPISEGVNGTIYYDMSGPAYQITTAGSNIHVSARNLSNGAEICAVIVSDGVQRTLGYDGGFSWFGTQIPYTPTTADKKVLVALSCISATGTNVIGATSAQL